LGNHGGHLASATDPLFAAGMVLPNLQHKSAVSSAFFSEEVCRSTALSFKKRIVVAKFYRINIT